MLFNSGMFLKVFLPLVVILTLLLQKRHARALPWMLIAASLCFYGWGSQVLYQQIDFLFLLILPLSAGLNFILGRAIYHLGSYALLFLGIAANLLFLGYFKYFVWVSSLLLEAGIDWMPVKNILLPLAISFYTFEQISYLVDCRKKIIAPASLRDYLLFVTFFPKLLAGPIVRFAEFGRQINSARISGESFATGITLFIIGLAKKILLADQAALHVPTVFDAAHAGHIPSFTDAWIASLAYSLQIYFDFSGYSDMAIGLALIFGIHLSINFYSPYKATSIIDFWRRWHMTLSRFLRDYIYFPLGGSRHGALRKYGNIILVMAIGGLWHGAGLTFVVWGLLHGSYLAINHLLRQFFGHALKKTKVFIILSWLVTFLSVVIAWVFFRAASIDAALHILSGMATFGTDTRIIETPVLAVIKIVALLAIALLMPNSNQLIGLDRLNPDSATDMLIPKDARQSWLRWNPNLIWAIVIGFLALAHLLTMSTPSPFLYFQF